MPNSKFVLLKAQHESHFSYQLNAHDGKTLLYSHGFETKCSCIERIAAVSIHASYDSRFEKLNDDNGYMFFLKSSLGETAGKSNYYITEQERDDAITSVQQEAVWAPIDDLTLVSEERYC